MYQYRQIIFRLRQVDSIRGIAQAKLAHRKKLRQVRDIAIQQGWFKLEQRCSKVSSAAPYKEQIEKWVKQGVQASTIHAALQRQYVFSASYYATLRLVNRIKESALPVTMMLDFQPGDCAQVDFGAAPKLVDSLTSHETKTWIFVMVLAWSRHMYAEIVLRQDVETWLGCHRRAFEWFNGIPKKVTIDNAK
jgi:transposase